MRPDRKLKVIVTRRLPREIEARMMELFDTRLNEDDQPLDRESMQRAVADADVLPWYALLREMTPFLSTWPRVLK